MLCNQLKIKPREKINDMCEHKFIIKVYKYKFIYS